MYELAHHRLTTDGVSIHYVTAGEGVPLVLLHGWPQTWYQWRPVIERLPPGFRIIAPDLRGIGSLPGPATGYDKHSMARDVRAVVARECGDEPAILCGHDMGSFVAFAYALNYRSLTKGLILIDSPPLGTKLMEDAFASPRSYHIHFHSNVDVALMLVTGRERQYIQHAITQRAYDPSAISSQEIDVYTAAYSAPGGLRAGFEWYRAFPEDVELNRAALARDGKLDIPVVVVGGSVSLTGPRLGEALDEICTDGTAIVAERSGHWVNEERPDVVVSVIENLAAKVCA